MSTLAAPVMAAALFAIGGMLLLVSERKGRKAGHVFLGALAVCAVIGLAVTVAFSPGNPVGSSAEATTRTMVE